jgi:hypothetical protein
LLADFIAKQIADALVPGPAFDNTRARTIAGLNLIFDLLIVAWAATKLTRGFAAQAKMARATAT